MSDIYKKYVKELIYDLLYKEYESFKKKAPIVHIEYFIKHKMSYDNIDSGFSRLEKFIVYNDSGDITTVDSEEFDINVTLYQPLRLSTIYTL